jgi:hypothetical protein
MEKWEELLLSGGSLSTVLLIVFIPIAKVYVAKLLDKLTALDKLDKLDEIAKRIDALETKQTVNAREIEILKKCEISGTQYRLNKMIVFIENCLATTGSADLIDIENMRSLAECYFALGGNHETKNAYERLENNLKTKGI